MAFRLPELPYSYDALEPHIDAKTMEIHHSRHHQGYVNKVNSAIEEQSALDGKSVEELLSNLKSLPDSVQGAVRKGGGGHANHSLFWQILSPSGGGTPEGELAASIDEAFGSFDDFKKQFKDAATGQFGSGWAWLVVDKDGTLKVTSTANQDNPIMDGLRPILGLDVWEHAYYLNYQNRRGDYVDAFWELVDWEVVGKYFNLACNGRSDGHGEYTLSQFPIYQTGIPGTPPRD